MFIEYALNNHYHLFLLIHIFVTKYSLTSWFLMNTFSSLAIIEVHFFISNKFIAAIVKNFYFKYMF